MLLNGQPSNSINIENSRIAAITTSHHIYSTTAISRRAHSMMSSGMTYCLLVRVVLLLIVPVYSSGDNCEGDPTDPPPICPSLAMNMPERVPSLHCKEKKCGSYYVRCDLRGSSTADEVLTAFSVSQCTTDHQDGDNFLGLQFSWSINAGNERSDLILGIAVEHKDNPISSSRLDINLTNQLTAEESINFTTTCLPLGVVQNRRELFVKAQVNPGSRASVSPEQKIVVKVECSNVQISLKSVCPAMPGIRPKPHNYSCQNNQPIVAVTIDASPPPGIGSKRTYNVTVVLFDERIGTWIGEKKTMNATKGRLHPPSATFANVPAGTYEAQFAYNDALNGPCENTYYASANNITVPENACRPTSTSPTETTEVKPSTTRGVEGVPDETLWMISAAVGVTLMAIMILSVVVCCVRYRNLGRRRRSTGLPSKADSSWIEREHIRRFLEDARNALPGFRPGVPTVVSDPDTELHSPDELISVPDAREWEHQNGICVPDNGKIGYGPQSSNESGYFGARSTSESDDLSLDETMIISH